MPHRMLQNPSLTIGITLFGTTFGCINPAFFQWLKSKKKTDGEKIDQPNEGLRD